MLYEKGMTISHMFQWGVKDITKVIPQLVDQGFTHFQFGPIFRCKEGWEYWKLYQPLGPEIGNAYCTYDDLVELSKECEKYGIIGIVDIVLRQLGGGDSFDTRYQCHPLANQTLANNPEFWMDNGEVYGDECDNNRWKQVNCKFGVPCFNYYNPRLWDEYYEPMLRKIRDLGFGVRLDMAKHIALPEEGCDLIPKIAEMFDGLPFYGECINLKPEYLEKYSKYMLLLIADYEPFWDSDKTVRFFESHDTYYSPEMGRYTMHMSDQERLDAWMRVSTKFKNKIFFVRPMCQDTHYQPDQLLFSDKMRECNILYKG